MGTTQPYSSSLGMRTHSVLLTATEAAQYYTGASIRAGAFVMHVEEASSVICEAVL